MIKESITSFNDIYDETYDIVLKYIVCNSNNINDVNDIIQEVYFDLYKKIEKGKVINVSDIRAYVIGIAKNKIKKYYSFFYKVKTFSIFNKNEDDIEYVEIIRDNINLEEIIINKNLYNKVWEYVKTKKNIIGKIFFLYYSCDLTINEIANILELSPSCVKNNLYRTLSEIRDFFDREV